jgi:hypothetical protein
MSRAALAPRSRSCTVICSGGSARASVCCKRRASWARSIIALTDAVAIAHRAGVVHRDLKPENARVDPAPSVRLTGADLTPGTPYYIRNRQSRELAA